MDLTKLIGYGIDSNGIKVDEIKNRHQAQVVYREIEGYCKSENLRLIKNTKIFTAYFGDHINDLGVTLKKFVNE
jgi:hypothetical protein